MPVQCRKARTDVVLVLQFTSAPVPLLAVPSSSDLSFVLQVPPGKRAIINVRPSANAAHPGGVDNAPVVASRLVSSGDSTR